MPLPSVRCPQCGKRNEYSTANTFRPFCSQRCKMIDLGAWASDQYSIAGKTPEADDFLDALGDPNTPSAPDTRQ